ncbi:MAG: hypothetical protein QFB86_02550 [Patescibacteria group bacterium]|nr:hypothetical protein [Patescibacteria group bacterium]
MSSIGSTDSMTNRQITVEITQNARVTIKKVPAELVQEETDIM